MAIELIAISLIGCILTSSASSNLIDLIGLICLVSLIGHILLAEEYLPSLVAGGTYTDYSEGNKWHGSCHFFGVCGCSFYHRHRELKTHDSGFVVARASDAPMPVHCWHLLTPWWSGNVIAISMPRGSILMKRPLSRISERGLIWGVFFLLSVPSSTYGFWRYFQRCSDFKKKHLELFLIFSKVAMIFKTQHLRQSTHHFDSHGNVTVKNCAHCPMKEVQGFHKSH